MFFWLFLLRKNNLLCDKTFHHVTEKKKKQINSDRLFFECQPFLLAAVLVSFFTPQEIHELKKLNFHGTETRKLTTTKISGLYLKVYWYLQQQLLTAVVSWEGWVLLLNTRSLNHMINIYLVIKKTFNFATVSKQRKFVASKSMRFSALDLYKTHNCCWNIYVWIYWKHFHAK